MIVEDGIYVLTEEVTNPCPDKRTKHRNCWDRPAFPEGMQFRIEVSQVDTEYFREILKGAGVSEEALSLKLAKLEPTGFRLFPVNYHIPIYIKFKHEDSKKDRAHKIWRALKPLLKPARKDTFGHVLHTSSDNGSRLSQLTLGFIYLLEEGKISLEDVAEVIRKADDTDEETEQALYKKHTLV